MTEQEVRDFLAQFDQAREDFKTWPQWMQDAAVERAATFPRAVPSIVTISRKDAQYAADVLRGAMRWVPADGDPVAKRIVSALGVKGLDRG